MKILQITPAFFPSLGGIEQHVLNLSKQLKEKGHSVDILTAKIGQAESFESIDSIKVFRINAGIKKQQELSFKGKNLVLPFFFKALNLHFKKKYDLIHVHGPFSLLSVMPLKLFKIPIVLTVHGNWINCIKGRRYYQNKICFDYDIKKCAECLDSNSFLLKTKRKILQNTAKKCSALIAVSNDVKNSIKLKKQKQVFVIPNVASKDFSPDKKGLLEFNFHSLKKKVLFVGSLIPEKGAKILLKTAKNIDAEFIFVYSYADKNYFQELKEFIYENNLKDIKFFYRVPNKKVREVFIPFSDVIVIPSLWPEPCSSIATEAMSSGKPVIASNTGGFPDLIKDKTDGFLFETGNSKELEKKILLLFDEPEVYKKISFNALKKTKEELNWNTISDKIIEVYKKVLK